MRPSLSLILVVASTLLPSVLGAAVKVPVTRFSGPKKAGSYIVTLKNSGARASTYAKLTNYSGHVYDKAFNGFSATLTPEQLEVIQADPNVASIEEDGTMYALGLVTQTNAPWGLGRISQNPKLSSTDTSALTYQYRYDSTGTAAGVDVYVVDTGIYTAHAQFGGRAVWGATFGSGSGTDGNGHGTHCAGVIGSSQFGVAKSVKLIAVKVLGDTGAGTISDIVAGLNWIIQQAQASGRPSVVSMSIGGSASAALDNAVNTVISAGIPVVVAAGGSASNVANYSPARVPAAVTVAASDIQDRFVSSSNYGAGVDIIAPGVDIISTWIGSTTATARISGTTSSTAFVAGLIAYFASESGSATTGQQLMIQNGVPNVLTGVPAGTINLLANNEF